MIDTNDTIALKDIVTITSPVIKSLVDTFVTPKLESLRNKLSQSSEIEKIPTDEDFTEYYHRTFKKLIVVNTLVFNNSQKLLNDIFIPLTISSNSNYKKSYEIDLFPQEILDEYSNVLITDTAGMGKSTLMKKIFLEAINNVNGIPIFIELRRLTKNKKLIEEIQEQLNSANKNFDENLLMELISEGGFIIILDGYDEIALSDRDAVTADIQLFISKNTKNYFFVTSRPEKALTSFGNFQEFKIDPLTKKKAFELLRKYDNQGTTSSLLIKKLQEQDMKNIEEFLINPLLVSLLFTAFEHKQAIPFKKYLFYRQVYDANFENHDLTKGESYIHDKNCKLEIDDFHRVMRHLGFNCFKLQRIEFTKDELLKLLNEAREFCAGLIFKESDFLLDILKTVPLFTQDGNYYRWSHKSLQEYFAAQFIYLDSKEKQDVILSALYNHSNLEKFINVLDLYYDMDYKTFRNVIEKEFLIDYEDYIKNEYNEEFSVSEEIVINRKEITFLSRSFLFLACQYSSKIQFDKNKLNLMIDEGVKKYKLNELNGRVLNSKNQYVHCIHSQNPKYSLISLLSSKKNPIIRTRVKLKRKEIDPILIEITTNEEYKLLEINDSLDNIINNFENFEKINKLIKGTRLYDFSIDNNVALHKLKIIRESIESEKDSDFLIGGI